MVGLCQKIFEAKYFHINVKLVLYATKLIHESIVSWINYNIYSIIFILLQIFSPSEFQQNLMMHNSRIYGIVVKPDILEQNQVYISATCFLSRLVNSLQSYVTLDIPVILVLFNQPSLTVLVPFELQGTTRLSGFKTRLWARFCEANRTGAETQCQQTGTSIWQKT